jgi:hypothetical protein
MTTQEIIKRLGQVRIRQTGYEFVVEEYRWSGWQIIEGLFSWDQARQAAKEYNCEII